MSAFASTGSINSPVPVRVLITAGPTAEDIDPVRFITNRSTGRMGLALASAVRQAGGVPRLILGPTSHQPPPDIDTVRIRSAADMHAAVMDNLPWAESLVMAAAVADYTPAEPLTEKMKKQSGDLLLRLCRTRDILLDVSRHPQRTGMFIVGFSLDVGMNLDEGRRKLREKRLDLIVVNTVSSFGSNRETATIVTDHDWEDCGDIAKEVLAERVVSRILSGLRR